MSMSNPHLDILTIGEILVDLVAVGTGDLGSASSFVPAPGGAPANVAVAARRLGARSGFIGAVGDDPFGSRLRQVLEEEEVDARGLQTVKDRTTLAFVTGSAAGFPEYIFYRGADTTLTSENLPLELIGSASCLYAGSMALLADPSRGATLTAVMHARSSGAMIAFDPNLRPNAWPSIVTARQAIHSLIERADVVKMNEKEALLLTGLPKLDAAINALSDPGRLLVVTRGADGCLWRWRHLAGEIDAPSVDVIDSIGAGDAFMGALLVQLCRLGYAGRRFWTLRRDDLESALHFACAAGALACTRAGAMPALPTREEIESLVSSL
jgi:fructokinase